MPDLIEGGVIGFKPLMGNTFGKIPSPSPARCLEALEVVAETGKRISLHAETNTIPERRQTRLTHGRTPRSAGAYRLRGPPSSRRSRQPRLHPLEWTGARIHILHISSADELRPCAKPRHAASMLPARPARNISSLSTDDYAHASAGVIRVNPPGAGKEKFRSRSGPAPGLSAPWT